MSPQRADTGFRVAALASLDSDCLRCLRRNFSAVSMALSEEELDPKCLLILPAALGADIDHLIRKR